MDTNSKKQTAESAKSVTDSETLPLPASGVPRRKTLFRVLAGALTGWLIFLAMVAFLGW